MRGPLNVDAILEEIWDMINQFPITVQTSGSSLFLTHTDIYNSDNTSFGEAPMVLWHFETLRYQEGVPQVFSAVGTCAVVYYR